MFYGFVSKAIAKSRGKLRAITLQGAIEKSPIFPRFNDIGQIGNLIAPKLFSIFGALIIF